MDDSEHHSALSGTCSLESGLQLLAAKQSSAVLLLIPTARKETHIWPVEFVFMHVLFSGGGRGF